MAAWEYKTLSIKTSGGLVRDIALPETFTEECNNAGRDGWELISVLPLSEHHGRTETVELIFKRPR
ncbi:MAG: DUF4177 domain-containing protein [Candidatus Zixiibacteriota bacterium]